MQIWRQLEPFEQKFQSGVVTIGNYDGLHLGHQSLLHKAQEVPGPRVVMTFDPHPMQVLHPERNLKRLFPREDLFEQLPNYGVDLLVILPFDKGFAKLSAQEFLNRYVSEAFHPRHIVAGYDFQFGNGREGTLDVLRGWAGARGISVDVVSPLRMGAEVVSSRRIREMIVKGDVHGAQMLLGRPFYLRGEVVAGQGRGKTIGIPTLNQRVINETLPPIGVYVSRVRFGGQVYPSVTNVGTNPTFENGTTVKVETHVLDSVADWRGEVIDVELVERLREEKKFSGVEDLKKQIQSDILKARAVLRMGK